MVRTDHFRGPDSPVVNSIVVGASVVVLDGTGRVLLIRRADSGRYAIPGGGLELGETLTETARREVMEETGIAITVTGLVGVYCDPDHLIEFSDGEIRQEFSVCFRAEPVGGELRTSSESTDVRWVASDALGALDIHPSIRLRIRHGFSDLDTPYYS